MLWLIDTYQNKVSTDQFHMIIIIPGSSLKHIEIIFFLTADQLLVFVWITGSSQVILL